MSRAIRQHAALALSAVMCACVSASAPAQAPIPAVEARDRIAPLEPRVDRLSSRLAALAEDNPEAYLELGEEVASEARNSPERALARELLVLATHLAQRSSSDQSGRIAASALLALASMADNDQDCNWLIAIAESISASAANRAEGRPIVDTNTTTVSRDPATLDAASSIGLVRSGDGRRALRLLNKPGVEDLLRRMDKVLVPGIGGGADRIRTLAERYANCSQCRNRRWIKDRGEVMLCPSCLGRPGIAIPSEEVINQLRAESILLAGKQRTWAAQVVTDTGAPLRDLEPSDVAAAYRVDTTKTLWRNGAWRAPDKPTSKPRQPAPTPGADAPQEPTAAPTEAPNR